MQHSIKKPKALSSIPVTRADIAKIIKILDSIKDHGHDMISTCILKWCEESVLPPLELIFKSCIESATFASEWKKVYVVLVHKKGNKQSLIDYRPILLLPICGKIFEWLIYNKLFQYFIGNDLISHNHSALNLDIYVLISCYLLRRRFINLMMRALKLELYFLT